MEQCSPGYWLNSASRECERCGAGCYECRGGQCLSCHGKAYLVSGRCSLSCPPGQFPHHTAELYQCRPCHGSCRDCRGPGAANCLSCEARDSQLYNNTCHPTILHTTSTTSNTTTSTLSPTTTLLVWLSAGLVVSVLAYGLCGLLGLKHQNIENVKVSYSRVEQDKDTELELSEESEDDENQFLIIDKI